MARDAWSLAAAVVVGSCILRGRVPAQGDCNHNGLADAAEVGDGLTPDCNRNGIPDECDVSVRTFGLPVFEEQVLEPVGFQTAFALLVADPDEDGRPDLLSVCHDALYLHRNEGGGRFALPERLWPGIDWLGGAAMADIDGDGHLDIAASGCGFLCFEPKVGFLLGDGEGGFRLGAPLLLGDEARPIAHAGQAGLGAADLDGDGRVDLLVPLEDGIQVYAQEAPDSWEEKYRFAVMGALSSTPDLDGDGDPDVVGTYHVLLNMGEFKLSPVYSAFMTGEARSVVPQDFDGDGDLDLAALTEAPEDATTIWVIENLGAEGFRAKHGFVRPHRALALAAADFDGDGDVDAVSLGSRSDAPGGAFLQLNLEGTIFGAPIEYPAPTSVAAAIAADLDGDGRPDLASVTSDSGTLAIHLNRPAASSRDCDGDGVPDECTGEARDCDRNGVPDVCDIASGTARDCNGNGIPDSCDISPTLDLSAPRAYGPLVGPGGAAVADLDGDGDEDVAVANEVAIHGDAIDLGRSVSILLGDGSGSLVPLPGEDPTLPGIEVGDAPTAIAPADLDGDGDVDLAVAYSDGFGQDRITVHRNRGGLVWELAGTYPAAAGAVVAFHHDRDGRLDLLTPDRVYRNVGDATFEVLAEVEVATLPFAVRMRLRTDAVAADLDGDLHPDLASIEPTTYRLEVRRNLGGADQVNPSFGDPVTLDGCLRPWAVTAADLDGDGHVDLASACRNGGGVAVYRNDGTGRFAKAAWFEVGFLPDSVLTGDLDADGLPELIAGEWNGSRVAVLGNATTPALAPDEDGDGIPDGCSPVAFHRGDSNGDGGLDIADAIRLLGWLFLGQPAPACVESADADDDGDVNITDGIAILSHLFLGGPPPAPPGPPGEPCGLDPDPPGSAGDLGCGTYDRC